MLQPAVVRPAPHGVVADPEQHRRLADRELVHRRICVLHRSRSRSRVLRSDSAATAQRLCAKESRHARRPGCSALRPPARARRIRARGPAAPRRRARRRDRRRRARQHRPPGARRRGRRHHRDRRRRHRRRQQPPPADAVRAVRRRAAQGRCGGGCDGRAGTGRHDRAPPHPIRTGRHLRPPAGRRPPHRRQRQPGHPLSGERRGGRPRHPDGVGLGAALVGPGRRRLGREGRRLPRPVPRGAGRRGRHLRGRRRAADGVRRDRRDDGDRGAQAADRCRRSARRPGRRLRRPHRVDPRDRVPARSARTATGLARGAHRRCTSPSADRSVTPEQLAKLLAGPETAGIHETPPAAARRARAPRGVVRVAARLGAHPARRAARSPRRARSATSPIVVYCHHGVRSARALEVLEKGGFTRARHLTGGLDAWSVKVDAAVPRY